MLRDLEGLGLLVAVNDFASGQAGILTEAKREEIG